MGTVNQAGTPAAVYQLNNVQIQNERATHEQHEVDEGKNQPFKEERRSEEKIKKSTFKGSENIAHTINRNKEEMIEGRSSCLEGICFQVGSIFNARSNLKSSFTLFSSLF